jgi:glycerol transport system ATP-binding protein
MRASALRVQPEAGDVTLAGKVELAEISGSDTFVHVQTLVGDLVAQLTGVHYFELGVQLALYFNPEHVYLFDDQGMLVLSPAQTRKS